MVFDKLVFGVDNIASHSFTEGSDEKHIERIAPGAGVLGAWDDTAVITTTGLVAGFSIPSVGKGRIIISSLCEAAAGGTLKFIMVFKNASEVVGVSAEVTAVLTVVTDGGSPAKQYGTAIVFANDMCASSVELYVTALPAGALSVTLMAAAV